MIWREIKLNPANKITVSRILLIPVFIALALFQNFYAQLAALLVFVLAAATDSVDGYVARKYDMISDFGKFMDPLADKLLVTAALCVLVGAGKTSVWVLFIIIVREFVVTGLRLIAVDNGVVIAASMWGKVKTVLQIIVVWNIGQAYVLFAGVTVLDLLMWLVVAVTVISGCEYIFKNSTVLKEQK